MFRWKAGVLWWRVEVLWWRVRVLQGGSEGWRTTGRWSGLLCQRNKCLGGRRELLWWMVEVTLVQGACYKTGIQTHSGYVTLNRVEHIHTQTLLKKVDTLKSTQTVFGHTQHKKCFGTHTAYRQCSVKGWKYTLVEYTDTHTQHKSTHTAAAYTHDKHTNCFTSKTHLV